MSVLYLLLPLHPTLCKGRLMPACVWRGVRAVKNARSRAHDAVKRSSRRRHGGCPFQVQLRLALMAELRQHSCVFGWALRHHQLQLCGSRRWHAYGA